MGKETEGDNRERRRRAKEARDAGEPPASMGVTTGGSKQRRHVGHDAPHPERLEDRVLGKHDPEHALPNTRPGTPVIDELEPSLVPLEPGYWDTRFLQLDDRRVGYIDVGVGDEPLVLLHTFPLESRMWEYQFSPLSERYRLIAPDLMGFGRSDAPDTPSAYSMESWADDIAGVMADLELDRAVVIGTGLGAEVAFNLFRRHGDLVTTLVFADMRTEPDTPEERQQRDYQRDWLMRGGDVASLTDRWFELVAGDVWSRRAEAVKKAKQWAREAPRAGLIGALDAIDRRPDVWHDLMKVQVPALVVTGEGNLLVPPEMAEETAARIPRGSAVVLGGAGWFSNLESPGAFNDVLVEFLDAR
ncbi:MAG: putative 3-oxoadipate enol-lactonase [Acidimicrobiaceae bacterium]|nr:putative 3-oxoadipate enol-lactonase [Acidimicrobiaceae bacterium]